MTHIDKDALLGWLRDFKASEHSAKHCDLMDTGALDGEDALEAVIEHVENMAMEKEGRAMTHEERVVVSAYTGYLMTDFNDVHKYIEEKLGRPVWTHQLANDAIWAEIRKTAREDFQRLCEVEV